MIWGKSGITVIRKPLRMFLKVGQKMIGVGLYKIFQFNNLLESIYFITLKYFISTVVCMSFSFRFYLLSLYDFKINELKTKNKRVLICS